jgi:hypothetical protein
VAAGTFKRGWDGQGRAASIRRFERILDDQEPMEQARGHLALAAAAAAIPEEHLIKDNWARAVARYATSESASAEVDLASAAVSWDFPSPLRGTVLRSRRRSIFVSCEYRARVGARSVIKIPRMNSQLLRDGSSGGQTTGDSTRSRALGSDPAKDAKIVGPFRPVEELLCKDVDHCFGLVGYQCKCDRKTTCLAAYATS